MFELEPNLWDAEHPEWFIYDPESLSKVYDEIMHSINNKEIAVLKEKGVRGFRIIRLSLSSTVP